MREKIKLLHIIGSLGVGGCEKQLIELCRRLDKTKFEISLLWYAPTPDCMVDDFKKAGIKTIFFDKFSMPQWKFLLRIRTAIQKIAPDIVHTWLNSANFWGSCAAISCGVPHIISSYRVELRDGIKETKLLARLAEKALSKKILILTNSKAIAQSLKTFYWIPEHEVRVIYNAVSLEPCDPIMARNEIRQELGLPLEQKIVLMVASQKMQKNHPMLIRTARRVCKNRPDVTFVAVGREERKDELNLLINQNDVRREIIFTGQQNDVHRWLAAADIFCLTSHYEGFPNAILEAMMAGLPVVTTAFPGVDEIIEDSATGCIVPLDDDAAMAREVLRLLDSPAVSQQLGANAQAKVSQIYSWDTLLRRMEDLYSQLCNKIIQP